MSIHLALVALFFVRRTTTSTSSRRNHLGTPPVLPQKKRSRRSLWEEISAFSHHQRNRRGSSTNRRQHRALPEALLVNSLRLSYPTTPAPQPLPMLIADFLSTLTSGATEFSVSHRKRHHDAYFQRKARRRWRQKRKRVFRRLLLWFFPQRGLTPEQLVLFKNE